MLVELRITDFGIIDHISVELGPGLTAITGETGAGKSMVVDALNVALGSRLGPESIRHGASGASIEAIFVLDSVAEHDRAKLAELGVDETEEVLCLRRETVPGGRSLARLNGRTLPMASVSAVGEALVDLHGQSEHLSLLRPARQLDMLDHFANLDALRLSFAQQATALRLIRSQLKELRSNRRTNEQMLDLLTFQVEEIDRAALSAGEEEELTAERKRLASAEKLAALATSAYASLAGDGDVPGAADSISEATRRMVELAQIDPNLDASRQVVEELHNQVQEVATTIRRYRDTVEFDPPRLATVEERLDEISRLKRKYGDTIEAVLDFGKEAKRQLDAIEHHDLVLEEMEGREREIEAVAAGIALQLSESRREAATAFAEAVLERLQRLGLGHTRFEVTLERRLDEEGLALPGGTDNARYAYTSSGVDQIQLMVAFNPGEPLRPIEKVASGGESARFMLAVKAALASADDVPTLVFDEIDTGVGGRSGQIVGEMLKELAKSHQVIAITHLAQIAALADHHIKVLKRQTSDRTTTYVEVLSGQAREEEVAEMLAGRNPGEGARKSARDMLSKESIAETVQP